MNSLLTQTYPNIELILVDDGSTDNSPAMCDNFARKDSRVKVIHQTNKGTGAARNTGIDSAKGELIGFADADDFASPEMYAKLYALMLKEHADVSVCEFTFVDAQGNEIPDKSNRLKGGVMTKIQALEYAILPVKDWSWHSVVP